MRHVVFDATVVRYGNIPMEARASDSVANRRLAAVEGFVIERAVVARYNPKLAHEYQPAFDDPQNDVIAAMLIALADTGIFVKSNTLSRPHYARMRDTRWPSHDQHLLAAAVEGKDPLIFTCEDAHGVCAKAVRREFGIAVTVL
jgi:hypothetical protein